MNRSIVSVAICLSLVAGGKAATFSDTTFVNTADTIPPVTTETMEINKRYETSSRHFRHFWHVLTPRRIVVQYAGGIGFMSAGLGWYYGKNKAWETDVLLGFVPRYTTGRAKATFTIKETYSPFKLPVFRNAYYQPLACGLYLNTVFGHEFWQTEPTRYPDKYYGFSTAIRAGVFLGQRIRLNIPDKRRRWFKEMMFYYEANTCDLHIASWVTNKNISLWDIVNFSCGLKFSVF